MRRRSDAAPPPSAFTLRTLWVGSHAVSSPEAVPCAPPSTPEAVSPWTGHPEFNLPQPAEVGRLRPQAGAAPSLPAPSPPRTDCRGRRRRQRRWGWRWRRSRRWWQSGPGHLAGRRCPPSHSEPPCSPAHTCPAAPGEQRKRGVSKKRATVPAPRSSRSPGEDGRGIPLPVPPRPRGGGSHAGRRLLGHEEAAPPLDAVVLVLLRAPGEVTLPPQPRRVPCGWQGQTKSPTPPQAPGGYGSARRHPGAGPSPRRVRARPAAKSRRHACPRRGAVPCGCTRQNTLPPRRRLPPRPLTGAALRHAAGQTLRAVPGGDVGVGAHAAEKRQACNAAVGGLGRGPWPQLLSRPSLQAGRREGSPGRGPAPCTPIFGEPGFQGCWKTHRPRERGDSSTAVRCPPRHWIPIAASLAAAPGHGMPGKGHPRSRWPRDEAAGRLSARHAAAAVTGSLAYQHWLSTALLPRDSPRCPAAWGVRMGPARQDRVWVAPTGVARWGGGCFRPEWVHFAAQPSRGLSGRGKFRQPSLGSLVPLSPGTWHYPTQHVGTLASL